MNLPVSELALVAQGLNVSYFDSGGTSSAALAIDHLELPSHGLCAIVGASGCGKSTLLYTLAGLLVPRGARIVWSGIDLVLLSAAQRDSWRRKSVGFVFQDFRLIPELTSLDNVLLPLQFEMMHIPADLRQRAQMLLETFGVPHQRSSVAVLSRGEAQRVALARALLRDPSYILADEPTASLDATAAFAVIEALATLATTQNKLVICVTHDRELMARADHVIRLDHGRLVS